MRYYDIGSVTLSVTSCSAVKYQMKLHAGTLKVGDVLMSNSPQTGGSSVPSVSLPRSNSNLLPRHLPDITIITPVFDTKTNEIIFFTASRGHHADIGGILPGSMPPTSITIFEEGANVESFKIVSDGIFDKKGLDKYMIEIPASYPGSSGCRNIRDVESDLKAVRSLTTYVILPLIGSAANRGEP